jgi:hypothetical protein
MHIRAVKDALELSVEKEVRRMKTSGEDFESAEDMVLAVIKLMIETGIPDHLIYACDKTGLLFIEEGWKNASPKDRRAWNKALDEFDNMTDKERSAWRTNAIARSKA